MKRFLLVAVTAVVALQPIEVSAQIYNGTPGNTEYLNFLGADTAVVGTFNVYVGAYKGSFASNPGNTFSIYCVDYLHYAHSHKVNVSALDGGSLSNTRLNDYAKYQRAAYLSSLFDSWGAHATGLSQATVWSGLHAAIWSITSGVTKGSGDTDTANRRDYFLGLGGYGGFSTAGWYVLSPGGGDHHTGGQEFLMRGLPRTSVPEPSTFLLMATGLCLIIVVRRKSLTALTTQA